jgi:flavin reductase (DIM6/NTAB) family NADH-FMN oxidoreductase RutF
MRRPWNIINCPVYSLSTFYQVKLNMNICTYVTAISMQPKLFAIALYEGTQSLENALNTDEAVLQLLTINQAQLVKILGKKTGKNFNKENYLKKRALLSEWKGFSVLNQNAANILLTKQDVKVTGDHHLFTYSVKSFATFTELDVLHFQDLIDLKIIL